MPSLVDLIALAFVIAIIKGNLTDYWYTMAKSIDQHGNVAGGPLFNLILGKGFGNEDETISSVLGRNKKDGTLMPMGKAVAWGLNRLDKNHVEKSIGS